MSMQVHLAAHRGDVLVSNARRLRAPSMLGQSRRSRQAVNRRQRTILSSGKPTQTLLPPKAQSIHGHPEDCLLQAGYPLSISWAGAGIFFFWQLGAAKYLMELYDLTKVPMTGASGGALAAVLCGCNVDPDKAFESAYQLSIEHQIWTRPLGLVGIWGSLIEKWLDSLLPDNAAELCRGRISIIITALPKFQQVAYNDFRDRDDLINVAMTSAHVPFFLDGKLGRPCRDTLGIDGSFPDFFTGDNSHFLVQDGRALLFDYFHDSELQRKGRMEFLELKAHDEIERIMRLGYQYAKKLHEEGNVAQFDSEFCRRALCES